MNNTDDAKFTLTLSLIAQFLKQKHKITSNSLAKILPTNSFDSINLSQISIQYLQREMII